MNETGIEWTDLTWNPTRGCSRVSPGCEHCYAETIAHRLKKPGMAFEALTTSGRWNGKIELVPEKLDEPLRLRKPSRIFVNSMSDLFHEDVPDEYIDRVFAVMGIAERHTFQVLTKRPKRMRAYVDSLERRWSYATSASSTGRQVHLDHATHPGPYQRAWPFPNVWLGVSAENQATADERIPLLLDTPAAVRFVSAEPLLGAIDLKDIRVPPSESFNDLLRVDSLEGLTYSDTGPLLDQEDPHLDWVVVGGEAGPKARPCHIEWMLAIVNECLATDTRIFVKQVGRVPVQRGNNKSGPAAILEQGRIDGQWPLGTRFGNPTGDVALNGRVAILKDREGRAVAEWPDVLRWQEYPEPRVAP